MTAYVNDEQKKEGAYGKAVKATLAATLAAGMVPAAAAFADEPAEAAEGNDVELLSASAKDAWEAGKFTVADNAGKVVYDKMTKAEIAEAVKDEPVEFTVDGDAHFLVPTMVAPMGGASDEVFADNASYEIKYTTSTGAPIAAKDIKEAGAYKVTVTAWDTDYQGASATFDFELVDATTDIKDAKLYQVKKDEKDFSDNVVEYTGTKFYFGAKFADDANKLNIVVDGKALTNGTDYAVEVFEASNPATSIGDKVPAECGNYIAKFTGKGAYTGTFQVTFDVVELDLAQAEIVLNTDNALVPVITSINGGAIANNVADVKVTAYPALGDSTAKGEYTYVVSANGSNKNVKGAQTIKHIVAANKATFKYGDAALKGAYNVNHVDGDKDFDLSKVVACDKNGEALDAKAYSVKVYDNKTKEEVSASKISEAGEWLVKIVVDAKATDYEYAGEAESVVTVTEGDVADGNVYFTFGGKVVKDSVEATYDGSDALKKLGVKLYDAKGNEVSASDYKVEVKDSEDKVVTSAVDAGTYTVSVTSDKYTVAGTQELDITINAIEAGNLRIDPSTTILGEGWGYAYTGSAIVPVIQYSVENGEFAVLPEDAYTLEIVNEDGKAVDEIKELGGYTITVKGIENGNYKVYEDTFGVIVSNEKLFADVAQSDWFYEHVYNAQKAGYMTGIGDSEIFAPNQATTRAMAATVLSRMAGAATNEGMSESFSDVDASDWFANEVAWAASTGIVSGYPGTDEFRPNSNVTRAEFCVMMQRYAAATGQGKALAAGEADEILAKHEDGAAVADWCKEAVAWAVKNEIFGGYSVLNPAGDITRAEMAKMTTVFQAAPLK